MAGDGSRWNEVALGRFLSGFSDTRFHQIVRHWLALRSEDGLPRRGEVDPAQFRDCLDMIWLMERHDDGHYRYRLAGQKITDIHGGIRRGSDTVDLFSPQALEMFRPRWEAVLDGGRMVRAEGSVTLASGQQTARVERLMLPLAGDDGSASVILGATSYERPRLPGLTTTDFPPTNIDYCPLIDVPPGRNR